VRPGRRRPVRSVNVRLPILDNVTSAPPAPRIERDERPRELWDSHGRVIRDVRLSLTDRCNFRCVYCMDPDVTFLRERERMSTDEIVRTARVLVSVGVRRIRLTGGEPMLHPDLERIVRGIDAIGFEDVSLTTNGSLGDHGTFERLKRAGLGRVTFSLDSLRPDRFESVTRSSYTPEDVLARVEMARRAGLGPVKINAVIVRGFNEDEIVLLARLARDEQLDVRFIEFMPLDSGRRWAMEQVVPADEIIERIDGALPIEPIGRERPSAPATNFRFRSGGDGQVGVIASVTRAFCGACSRLRITADAKVMPCLFSRTEHDLMHLLRSDADDDAIAHRLADITWTKQAGHGISSDGFAPPDRGMSAIGG